MPTSEELDARIRLLIADLIESAPPPPELPERGRDRSPTPRRSLLPHGHPGWGFLLVFVTVTVVLVLGLVVLVGRPGSKIVTESSLGFRITSYSSPSTPPQPHLLNDEIGLGYIPPGYHLISDTQTNNVTRPYTFQRVIT